VFLARYVKLGGGDTTAFHALEGQRRAGFERGERIDNSGLVRAGIRQRAHQHVAADPGEGVQIAEQGHSFIMDDQRSVTMRLLPKLYETDYFAWTKKAAAALRDGRVTISI
jgi:hypothetical protein